MNKVIEIRKAINTALKSIHDEVHFQEASNDAVYPYLVYDLPNSFGEDDLEQFVLDVDGWDDDTDTTALETLMDNTDKALNKKTFSIDDLVFTIHRDNRLSLTDKEARLRRRKYIYEIRTYIGGN